LAIVVVAALAAGAWAIVDHYTGGTTETTTRAATLTSTRVANTYVAALAKLQPSALTPILAANVVSVDWAYGDSGAFHSARTLERNWADVFTASGDAHFRGSLRAAAPDWAAVTWQLRGSTNPLTHEPFTMNGVSILNIKRGKIARETYYWDVPGRNPGIAATIGRRFATALTAHQPGWALTLRSLYSKDAIESDAGVAPSSRNVDNLIWGRFAMRSFRPLHASLSCAGPILRMDNGKTRPSWAVVNWVAQDASPGGGKVSGVSILQFRNGKIIRETMYY
jgi:SnoaL-like protein